MNDICVLIYHSNIFNVFKKKWVVKSMNSIYKQSFQNFDVIELCYDNQNRKLWGLDNFKGKYKFFNKKLDNQNEALNFLFKIAFYDLNYKYVFIVNLDDIYHKDRISNLIQYINKYDIISSNYYFLKNNKKYKRTIVPEIYEDDYNIDYMIKFMIKSNKRTIDLSGVIISKNVIDKCGYLDDDFKSFSHFVLWKKALKNNLTFFISSEYLLYYRLKNNKKKINLL